MKKFLMAVFTVALLVAPVQLIQAADTDEVIPFHLPYEH
ncbi:hypothetical protein SAMN05421736_107115 [Evansella caseinilytica]|uniref:Uncharacterized protein n=1 Tax=Evansella caseinilytica TaxID=1503961 RepID=A0A1H3QZJ5_9BACI|nr:hypothetical protein SAMN05421736_107115 [Evansella caseinilytica]